LSWPDLPLEGLHQSPGDDVGELFIFECFNERFQIEPAVGDDPEHLDAGMDTLIGGGKEGEDVVPGCDVARAVPKMDNILASVEKGQKRAMARSAVLGGVVSLSSCSP